MNALYYGNEKLFVSAFLSHWSVECIVYGYVVNQLSCVL